MCPFDNILHPDNLAADQEIGPTGDFDALLGDFWPENEEADEFVAALRRWRHDVGPKA